MSLDDLFHRSGEDAGVHAPGHAQSSPTSGTPLLRVHELALSTKREPVFGPVDWQVNAGQLGVIVGEQGSGRTSALLALGGRMRGITGSIEVDWSGQHIDGVEHPRQLLLATAVARIGDVADIERLLTVGECVDERCVMEGISRKVGRERFHELKQQLGLDIDGETLVEELSAPLRTMVTALLACLNPAAYVLLDDLDASLTAAQRSWMVEQLKVLGERGHTFIVTALNTAFLSDDVAVLDLDAQQRDAEPELPPVHHLHEALDPGRPSHARPLTDADFNLRQSASGHRPAHLLTDADTPAPSAHSEEI